MTRWWRQRAAGVIVGAAGLVAASVLLVGCAGPDIDELEADAAAAFHSLVAAAESVEEGVLRTLDVSGPDEQPCGEEGRGLQRAFVAVGSVSVGADEAAEGALVDAVAAAIDPERWAPIAPDDIAGREGSWVDESGIVATISYDSPLLVVATFTPCLELSR